MTDLIDRLRGSAPSIPAMRDAANEIERLSASNARHNRHRDEEMMFQATRTCMLYDALAGLVGLVKLLEARDDMPEAMRTAIRENHRYQTAVEALKLEDEPTAETTKPSRDEVAAAERALGFPPTV